MDASGGYSPLEEWIAVVLLNIPGVLLAWHLGLL